MLKKEKMPAKKKPFPERRPFNVCSWNIIVNECLTGL